MGNGSGGYTLITTSSLGISSGNLSPAGSSGELQFNNAGSLGADTGLTYNSVAQRLTAFYASSSAVSASYISSTNLFAGSLTLGSFTGFLKATAGAIATALIDLASDVTGILPITNGGTALSTAPGYGQILVGNGSGGYALTATSSLGISGGGSGLSIGGSDTQVQFNASGSLSGNSGLVYNSSAERLTAKYVSSTGLTSLYVSSTNVIAGSLSLGSITGFLKATAGVISTALIDLASDITGILAISNGGTGVSSAPTYGQILVGTSGGGYALTATSSLGLSSAASVGGSDTQIQFNNGGNFGGSTGLVYNNTTQKVTATYVSSTALSSPYVSSTNVTAGSLVLGSLTGFLKATTGVIGNALIDVASDITGILPIANGGTALSSAPSYGQLLMGNSSGGYTLTATSSLGLSSGGSGTVNSGTLNQLAYYGANGTTLSGIATSSLGLLTTHVSEGSNLYYLDSRAQSFIHSSSTIPKTYTGNTFTGNNIFSGALTFGSLNGPLQANNGVVSASTSIGVTYGGTGLTSAPTYGQILVGTSGGGYALTATSSLGLSSGGSGTVNTGTANQLAYYAANGTTVSGIATSSLGLSTTNVSEGSNLYYLDSRVQSFVHASTTIPKTYSVNTFTGSNLFNGGLTIGSLNGPLQANAGAISATTSIGVLYGGTGLTSAPSYGQILVGTAAGGYTLTATSSLGLSTVSIGGSDTQVQFNNSGSLGGSAGLTFNSTASRLTTTYISSTGFSAPYVSSTNLTAGSFTLGSLSGFLKATAGAITTALVDLASNVTGVLPVANGGSGTSTAFTSGSVVFADSNNKYSQSNSTFFWDNTNKRLGLGTASPGTRLEVSGTAGATHFKGIGNTPSVSAGLGAGTLGSVSVVGTDSAGQITVTAGTLPTAAATIVTLTFVSAYSSAPYISLTPANSTAAALSGNSMVYPTGATTNFTITAGSTALSNASVYRWNYSVIE